MVSAAQIYAYRPSAVVIILYMMDLYTAKDTKPPPESSSSKPTIGKLTLEIPI